MPTDHVPFGANAKASVAVVIRVLRFMHGTCGLAGLAIKLESESERPAGRKGEATRLGCGEGAGRESII